MANSEQNGSFGNSDRNFIPPLYPPDFWKFLGKKLPGSLPEVADLGQPYSHVNEILIYINTLKIKGL